MDKSIRFVGSLLRSPILWGGAASIVFFWLLHAGMLGHQFLPRYCAGHVVQYVETCLFFIALAALAIKGLDVVWQRSLLDQPVLGPYPAAGQTIEDCGKLRARLASLPTARQNHYLVRRLREAIDHVIRRGSSDDLDDHMKYLVELDNERLQASYGLIRLIIWTVPILGFLGTVVGITMAIASLKVDAVQDSMMEVTAGLGVKFDTTALALTLSIALVFLQFFLDRAENGLLERVARRAESEMAGRFPRVPAAAEDSVLAIRRLSEAMAASFEKLLQRQAELWRGSLQSLEERWTRMPDAVGKHFEKMIAGLAERTEVLGRAVEGTACVAQLEDTLNRNLAALAGAKNFEETVLSLAATIHLLNARLAPASTAAQVQLGGSRRTGHAA